MPEHWIMLLVIGLCSGILSGTLGIGAGTIMIPALAALAIPQKEAQGIALAVMVPMALAGAIRYKMIPGIQMSWEIIALLAIVGVVGALIGSVVAENLSNAALRKLFAVFLLVIGFKMLLMKS